MLHCWVCDFITLVLIILDLNLPFKFFGESLCYLGNLFLLFIVDLWEPLFHLWESQYCGLALSQVALKCPMYSLRFHHSGSCNHFHTYISLEKYLVWPILLYYRKYLRLGNFTMERCISCSHLWGLKSMTPASVQLRKGLIEDGIAIISQGRKTNNN